MIAAGTPIDAAYRHYPVQAWRLGNRLVWVALGGEVVVDYSHRLKNEIGAAIREPGTEKSVWVTAYANDVMAYIPSERVLSEGGYEGDTSMIAYGQPAKWAPGLEDKIVKKVKELAQSRARSKRPRYHSAKRRSISRPTPWLFSGWNCVANTRSCQTADTNGVG